MKILIVCVTYNTYNQLHGFLHSVGDALASAPDDVHLTVAVADNSTKRRHITTDEYPFAIRVFEFDNPGYFGAVRGVLEHLDPKDYDYVCISNVDLRLNREFVSRLAARPADAQTAWIAPCIYSIQEGRDKNPARSERPSRRRLQMLGVMYAHPWLNTLYERTLYRRHRMHPRHPKGTVYAGHGSFIILTRRYFEAGGKVDYPVFLFGEELYLAEEIRRAGLQTVYDPSLGVTDEEHVSTGTMRRSEYYRFNREAIDFIVTRYYGPKDK